MLLQPCRPSESERKRLGIKGEVHCERCSLPAGHPDCNHLYGQTFWNRLADSFRRSPPNEWRGETWGIAYPLDPPKDPYRYEYRQTLPKDEGANYHFVSNKGWEVHVRRNDHTGYQYTVHFEISPEHSNLGHIGDIIIGQNKSMREMHRLVSSAYEDPVPLRI